MVDQHTHGKKLKTIPSVNVGLSKSAKIVLSKSIFEVRNEEIFFFSFISEYQIIRPFFGTNMIFEILFPRFNF